MSLSYPNQITIATVGSKSSANAITPVTLKNYYDFDGTASAKFTSGGMSKADVLAKYTAGAGETGNSLQMKVEASSDGTNWYSLVNESVSDGTSTLTQREFTIAQATTYGTLAYDAQSANFTAGLLVTGAGGATGIIESDTDSGTAGTLLLSNISGTFVNDEALTDSGTGAATVNGVLTSITYFSIPLDISEKWHRISFKETGVASNYGTIFAEVVISGR